MRYRLAIDRRASQRGRGISLVWAIICMVALMGFVSLAVDVGRVQTAKTELRRAADAAARYAVTGVRDNTARAKAIAAAAENNVDGTPLALTNGDVQTGTWASGTFNNGGSSPNAVRVRARRTAERGNPILMTFGRVLGMTGCDIEATAIACIPDVYYGVVGLNTISMGGNSSTSYWSSSGTVSSGPYGSIASNGSITLSGSTYVNGDARAPTVNGASGRVAGSTSPLTTALSFPNGNAGTFATVNDNAQVAAITGPKDLTIGTNQTVALPAGTYYLHDLNLSASGTLNVQGPVTLYVYHNVTLNGSASTPNNLPKNLKIIVVPDVNGNPPGFVKISGGSSLYASIYAPQSDMTLSGTGDFYGNVLANNIFMTGTSAIHYDLALSGSTGVIQLVK